MKCDLQVNGVCRKGLRYLLHSYESSIDILDDTERDRRSFFAMVVQVSIRIGLRML